MNVSGSWFMAAAVVVAWRFIRVFDIGIVPANVVDQIVWQRIQPNVADGCIRWWRGKNPDREKQREREKENNNLDKF